MQTLGLTPPASLPFGPAPRTAPPGPAASDPFAPRPPRPGNGTIGGTMNVRSLADMQQADTMAAALKRANEANARPVVQSMVSHIKNHWSLAKTAKQDVEKEMLSAVRARRGEYDPQVLSRIRAQGGSEIYMMLFATKARQAKALLVDVLVGAGTDKTWTITPTPDPELPPDVTGEIMQSAFEMAAQSEMAGLPMSVQDIRERLVDAKASAVNQINETARIYAARAERAIEDRLVEGGWIEAMDQFLDDMMVFKTAFIKGPVVRNLSQLEWVPNPQGGHTPQVKASQKLQWERVDPFNIYPSSWNRSVHDGYLIEKHKLGRSDLNAMIGVDGYSEDAIRAVLDEHGTGGLKEWLSIETERAQAEGNTNAVANTGAELIDALQYWGSVSGKMLREWGMSKEEVPDEAKEYEVEAWLVGNWVIKAVLNPDPLARRPYYSDGYSRIPGAFWHNSLFDVLRDCQDMCNSAARALSNNLGIASGPQVSVNVDRLPPGEAITQMHPWKIWQFSADPMGSSAPALDFFQPNSNANELMGVFQKFSELADEYSGIPKYMTGIGGGEGGAGRTASGMSMMIGNASKQIKQLVSSIDIHVVSPAIERAYQWLMQYDPDTDLKGDLKVVARGALSLVTKEAAQVRRNEFLMATMNPVDMQIIGVDGRAELLRESAKSLNINTDKVVPSATVLKERALMVQLAAQQQGGGMGAPGGMPGAPAGPAPQTGNGQVLMGGQAQVDNFSPTPQQ